MPPVASPFAAAPSIGAVGTPLPQTAEPHDAGGPFIRYARDAARPGYTRSGDPFGGLITTPLPSAPGYARGLWITVLASGGAGAGAVGAADAPWNVIQSLQFKDPWGTPVYSIDGYSLAKIVNPYSGQAFLHTAADPQALPSFSAIAGTGGGFQFKVFLPIEATIGYGVMSIGNASVLPTLTIQLAASGVVYTTPPATTLPTLTTTVDWEYYDIDPSVPVAPPGNGTSLQWFAANGDQPIGSNSSVRVRLPHTGGYITTLGLLIRDSTGARFDAWNTAGRVRLYIDGVPQYDETFIERVDHMFAMTGGLFTRPTGLAVYSFKQSLTRENLGLLDTLEVAMQTTPGTQIEVEMTPWAAIGNAPATLTAVYGQIVPAGPIAQGLIEA